MTVGRFAPSPSGPLHVGNLRTALIAWCLAREGGGSFLVRVEDLTTGAEPIGEAEHLADLAALGLVHDGPVVRQSERTASYDAAIDRLVTTGVTYPCFCTRREIRREIERASEAPHGPSLDDAYPGTCRNLTDAERSARLTVGRPAAVRLRAGGETVGFVDGFVGPVQRVVDDFVLRRADGLAAYNLAVVVDDAAAGVDQVVRGDDLVDTTPRQILLQRMLGLPTPEYVHVPLVLGLDGERLAKRHGAVSRTELERRGVGSRDLLARLARSIGIQSPGHDGGGTVTTGAALVERFDLGRLPRGPVTFDTLVADFTTGSPPSGDDPARDDPDENT